MLCVPQRKLEMTANDLFFLNEAELVAWSELGC